jgi:excisionase family DNA binding protein
MAETGMELLTVDEAAKLLKIKRSTLYTWAYHKDIPSQKVGGALRFNKETLARWLRAQERGVRGELAGLGSRRSE